MYDVIIRNGEVVTEQGVVKKDVAVLGEKIAALGEPGTLGEAKKVIDAAGKYVLPGLIDPHVHIHHPFKGGHSCDDFYTATKSAAFGGDTTVCDFAIQWDKEKSIADTCAGRKEQFEGDSVTDFAFHACPTVASMDTIEGLKGLVDGDVPSVKLYMTYSKQGRMSDDAILYEALKVTAQHGGIVGVHAENDAMCCFYSDEYKKAGTATPTTSPCARTTWWRRRPSTGPSTWPRSPAAPCISSTCPASRAWSCCGRPGRRASTCTPRPAPTTRPRI